MLRNLQTALADLAEGIRRHRVWIALASEDIGDQHRRTMLGPLWLLLNYLAFAGTFIFIFDRGGGSTNYPAYAATGLLVWFYIMETVNQSVTLFVREESFIKGTTLPLSVYVLRLGAQSLIRAAYALSGCLAILIMSGAPFTAAWAWSGLGLLLIVAVTPAAIILFAFMGAYFPDSQYVVTNLMRIGMFLTPVFWVHDGSGGIRSVFYYWNPFTYFLEIVRNPILTGEAPAYSFALCCGIGAALWALALAFLGRYRKQVVFVL
jgi:ABC-type polysaccharide/polyol phosphate export permease